MDEELEAFRIKIQAALAGGGIDVVKWDADEAWIVVYDPDSEHEYAVTIGAL